VEKEILTIKNIQHDLRRGIRLTIIGTAIFFVFFLVLLGLELWGFRVDDLKNLSLREKLAVLFPFVLPLMLFAIVVSGIYAACKEYAWSKKPCDIVIDRLIDMEVKQYNSRTRRGEFSYLYFARYGEYQIPKENYTWSFSLSMDDEDVYSYSAIGDEFYLVLAPGTSNILLVYNTKIFDHQPTVELKTEENL
jgi:hypothetical protein